MNAFAAGDDHVQRLVVARPVFGFQGQEVACVIADDPYIAKDACEAIDVEYEPLPAIVNPICACPVSRLP